MKKEKAIRERIAPKIWDATYLLTQSNIKVFKQMIDLFGDLNKLKVLDLGCGYKPYKRLLPNVSEYIGVDFSKEDAEPDFVLDLNKDTLPFPDEYFDIVIISEVLEHLYNYENCLREAVRVLKPRGVIYISTPFVFHEHGTPYDFYRYTGFFYKRKLNELGLKIKEIKKAGTFFSIPFFTLNILILSIFSKIGLRALSYPIVAVNNIVALSIDWLVLKLGRLLKIEEELQYMFAGISILACK